MSNNNKSEINNKCEGNKDCCKSIYNSGIYKTDENFYKNLSDYYEKEDDENFFTSRGQEFVHNAKRILIVVAFAVALVTLFSIKKTLDNIDARMHNASSVTTK
jgi:hypothetical protein